MLSFFNLWLIVKNQAFHLFFFSVLNAMAQAQFHGLREIANDYQKAARADPPSFMEPFMEESISRHSRPSVNREKFQA